MVQCRVQGCKAKHKAKGYCERHYMRLYRNGTLTCRDKNYGSIEQRIWARVEKTEHGCWKWRGKTTDGYPIIGAAHGSLRVAREIYRMHFGEIPAGMFVCHRCDNPSCCNPTHLFLGTNQDNVTDMVRKGRNDRGASRYNAKLTDNDVRM